MCWILDRISPASTGFFLLSNVILVLFWTLKQCLEWAKNRMFFKWYGCWCRMDPMADLTRIPADYWTRIRWFLLPENGHNCPKSLYCDKKSCRKWTKRKISFLRWVGVCSGRLNLPWCALDLSVFSLPHSLCQIFFGILSLEASFNFVCANQTRDDQLSMSNTYY